MSAIHSDDYSISWSIRHSENLCGTRHVATLVSFGQRSISRLAGLRLRPRADTGDARYAPNVAIQPYIALDSGSFSMASRIRALLGSASPRAAFSTPGLRENRFSWQGAQRPRRARCASTCGPVVMSAAASGPRGQQVVILHRHPLKTSARKIHLYSLGESIFFLLTSFLGLGTTFKDREACAPWYDGRR